MWKYLIFDIDDTLLETFMNSYSIFLALGKQYGIENIDQNEFLGQYMWWDFDKNIEHFFGGFVWYSDTNYIIVSQKILFKNI